LLETLEAKDPDALRLPTTTPDVETEPLNPLACPFEPCTWPEVLADPANWPLLGEDPANWPDDEAEPST
jgi:hypothetical protein